MNTEIDKMTRRKLLKILTASGLASVFSTRSHAETTGDSHGSDMVEEPMPQLRMGEEKILILIFPGFTAIDAVGPEYVLSGMMGAQVKFVAKTLEPVLCETGFEVTPAYSFENCPRQPTLLLIPGGTSGILEAIQDVETLEFIQKLGLESELVGSVCTGSLLLGAAGLLQGYRATSHWQTLELMPLVGAQAVDQRVVIDRDRVTGAGVTAALDLAFMLVQRFRGDFYAKGMQLLAEYDPQPPFPRGGNHETADPRVVTLLNGMHRPFVDLAGDIISKNKI